MKRSIWSLLLLLTLAACSRKEPTPTSSPVPTLPLNPTPVASTTPTPAGSPVPRITIVPSATRLQPTSQGATSTANAAPTATVQLPPTPLPSSTPTQRVIDAGPTATPSPTATQPESPLPTPTMGDSPLDLPPSPTPTTSGQTWHEEKVFTHYDAENQEFYIWGEVVNDTDDYQRITTITPEVYDKNGDVISLEYFETPIGYDQLLAAVSLAPLQEQPLNSLSFGFRVFLPTDVSFDNDYKILVEMEPADPPRDLEITLDNPDTSGWPDSYILTGSYRVPDENLAESIAIVVTVFDEEERVIGLGWLFEAAPSFLTTEEHPFRVEVQMWEIAGELGLDADDYKVQAFGY
jgi:hypothetical protein